jgi:hypothetical protein
LSVQRQLPFTVGLTVAYAGSRGIDLIGERDANPTIPAGIPNAAGTACIAGTPNNFTSFTFGSATACWIGNEPRINPAWGYVRFNTTNNNSFYNSLQVTVQKQMSRGLQFQSSYTYSRIIDTTQGIVPADSSGDLDPTDALNQRTDRGRAAFDATHNWRFNTLYQLPRMASGPLGFVVNGWSVGGIVSLQNGYPFTVFLTRNRSLSKNNDNGADRASLVPGIAYHDITRGVSRGCGVGTSAISSGTPVGDPARWYDPCAFTIRPAGFLGNSGRNVLDGPGLINLDFSASKQFPLSFWGEGRRLEFRGEMFNIFNHPNFNLPNQTAYTGANPVCTATITTGCESPTNTAAQITGTSTKSRQI